VPDTTPDISDIEVEDPAATQSSDQADAQEGVQESDIERVNPEDLPPELQEIHKQLLGDYTRKTQALAAERKSHAENQKKAATLDLILQNETFRKMLAGQEPNGQAATAALPAGDDDEFIQKLEPDAVKGVTALFRKLTREVLEPEFQPVKSYIQKAQQRDVLQQWDALKKTYPGADKFQPQIVEFLQANPAIEDLKQAFFAVAGDQVILEAKAAASRNDTAARQQAQLVRPGMASHKTAPVQQKKSLADIFEGLMQKRG
jgi:hypothetical protein